MTMASARALLPKATMCVGKAPKASDKALLDRRGGMEWFHEGVRTVPKFVFFCNLGAIWTPTPCILCKPEL